MFCFVSTAAGPHGLLEMREFPGRLMLYVLTLLAKDEEDAEDAPRD